MSAPLWDVFISHASEDKEQVARPLAKLLMNAGLRVWIDENELRLGDSLRRKIDQGLAGSRYGVVVLSPSFFAKEWPRRELDALSALDSGSDKVILPVWHGIDHRAVTRCSPTLADKLAISTDRGLDQVALSIISVVSGSPREILQTYDKLSPPPPREFVEPKSLLGQTLHAYELTEFIGSGGSGLVFRATHKPTLRETAVKVFYPVRGILAHTSEMLEHGFRALAALRHPNIVGVLEFNTASVRALQLWFLAMEYVTGLPLDDWSRNIQGHADAFDRRLEAAINLADALRTAHETSYTDQLGFEAHGVLHGDVKPANVLVDDRGQVKLLDFLLVDLQRLLDPRVVPPEYLHRKRPMTEAFGTPGFMAPEQEDHGLVTVKTDIFSLGITFAHLFSPTSDDPVEQIFIGGTVPQPLCDLVNEMISGSPAARPSDIASVLTRLRSMSGTRRGRVSNFFKKFWDNPL